MAIRPLINENEILNRISEGDESAFTELFKWYYKPLGEFVMKLTDSINVTEEIVQDSFVKIWLRREKLCDINNFSNYLYILCRNQAFLVLKKIAAEKTLHLNFEKHMYQELGDEELDNPAEEYRTMIEEAVAKLPAQQKKVYVLSRYQRLKHEEIAKELNLSAETVKKHIQLAVQFIRKDVGTRMNPGVVLILTSTLILS